MIAHVLLSTLLSSLCISNCCCCCCCCCCSSGEVVDVDGWLTVPFKFASSFRRLTGEYLPEGPSDWERGMGKPRGDVLGDWTLASSPVFSSTGIEVDVKRWLFRFSESDVERRLMVSWDSKCLSFARSFLFSSSISEI